MNISGNYTLGEYIRQNIRYSLESRNLSPRSGASASIVAEKGETVLIAASSNVLKVTTNQAKLLEVTI